MEVWVGQQPRHGMRVDRTERRAFPPADTHAAGDVLARLLHPAAALAMLNTAHQSPWPVTCGGGVFRDA
jgi:hypothetical protein